MSVVNFFTEDCNYRLRKKLLIREWVLSTIKSEKKTVEEINFILTSDEYLFIINVDYLSHDTLTDIITFQYNEEGESIHSDIFISMDRVKENAAEYGQSKLNELHRMIIHGTLHLLGYKDKTESEKKEMTVKEDFYLSKRPIALTQY